MLVIDPAARSRSPFRQASIEAVVHPACRGCGAGNPLGTARCLHCGARSAPARRLGRIAYWHRNPLRRQAWAVGCRFRRFGAILSRLIGTINERRI